MGVVHFSIAFELEKGCENHPEVLAPDTTGQLMVKVTSATLQRDVSGWFSTMQPMVVVRFGDDELCSAVDIDGKLNPKWDDLLIFNRDEIQRDTIMLEIRNFSESTEFNELIGVGFLPFTQALLQKKIVRSIEIYHDGALAGNVQVEYLFKSATPEDYKKAEEDNKKFTV